MYRILKLNESEKLTEDIEKDKEEAAEQVQDDIDANEELEDVIDSEENQEENPVEEESELDKKLDELREVLVDLDLNLYRIASKEDPNNVIYIIGKVAEETNDTLMLIDTKPQEPMENDIDLEEPIIDNIEVEESEEDKDEEVEVDNTEEEVLETPEQRFDFVVLPKSFDEINKLNPRYGEDITPDHEAIMDYLMNCLIEINPEAAEEIQADKETEDLPIPDENLEISGEEDLEDED